MFRLPLAAARVQVQLVRRNIETLFPVFTTPLSALITLSILVDSGREDLACYALVAFAHESNPSFRDADYSATEST